MSKPAIGLYDGAVSFQYRLESNATETFSCSNGTDLKATPLFPAIWRAARSWPFTTTILYSVEEKRHFAETAYATEIRILLYNILRSLTISIKCRPVDPLCQIPLSTNHKADIESILAGSIEPFHPSTALRYRSIAGEGF
jgi:hypothetical protein